MTVLQPVRRSLVCKDGSLAEATPNAGFSVLPQKARVKIRPNVKSHFDAMPDAFVAFVLFCKIKIPLLTVFLALPVNPRCPLRVFRG